MSISQFHVRVIQAKRLLGCYIDFFSDGSCHISVSLLCPKGDLDSFLTEIGTFDNYKLEEHLCINGAAYLKTQ